MMRAIMWAAAAAATLVSAPAWSQASPSNFTNAVRYDASRQVVGTIEANPAGSLGFFVSYQATRNTYDAAGRLTKVEKGYLTSWQPDNVLPANWTTFNLVTQTDITYDAMSRKTSEYVTSPTLGGVPQFTQYSYDAVGRLECTAVRMTPAMFGSLATPACTPYGSPGTYGQDRITRNTYDAANQLLKVQKAYGTSLQQDYATYEYTLNGKQKAVIDANGNRAEMTYDGFDRQDSWKFPSKTTTGVASTSDYEAYTYDANGNRTNLKKRDGRNIAYAYDALNRATSKTYPNGGARGVYYSYNLQGLQTAARFDSASGTDAVLSSWDGFGRQTTTTTAMGGTSRTMTSGYYADGTRGSLSWPEGNYVNYVRYDTGPLYYSALNNATLLIHRPLDALGRNPALYRFYAALGIWNANTSYGYDGLSRVTGLDQNFTNGVNNVASTFDYNPANQMTSRTRSNDAYAFNRYANASVSYAKNGLNQYTSVAGATYGYDDNGNLTSDGATTYTYDVENRLVGASNGAVMTYDPTGRLWQTSGTANGTTQFLYDGDALVAEYDGSGNMTARYVHGDNDDDPQVYYAGASVSSPSYLFADHQGSIVGIADINGNSTTINRYDEYGIPGTGNAGRFQYTGQAYMPDIGMYYYKARIYSPTLGRFLQTDPIGYNDQVNLYGYVGNDPINGVDPTGLCEKRDPEAFCSQLKGDATDTNPSARQPLGWKPKSDAEMREKFSRVDPPIEEDTITTGVVTAGVGAVAGVGRSIAGATLEVGGQAIVRSTYIAGAKSLGPRAWLSLKLGNSPETVARWAVSARNDLKVLARSFTPRSEVVAMEARNLARYGNPVGPSADQLYAKYGNWAAVISAATRTAGFSWK